MTITTPFRPVSGGSAGWESGAGSMAASRRYELREFAAGLPNNGGHTRCGRKIRKGRAGSSGEILYVTRWCGRKWLCPVCGCNTSRTQMNRVQRTLGSWAANGGAAGFLTLTQAHNHKDSLTALWERMDAGWAALARGSGWTADKRTFGLRGYFRATEVVHNPLTGWNVHFHVILLLDAPLNQLGHYALKDSVSNRFAHPWLAWKLLRYFASWSPAFHRSTPSATRPGRRTVRCGARRTCPCA